MNLALFDFDGTIANCETLGAFMHQAVEPRRLAVGKLILAPLIAVYKVGLVSGNAARAAIIRFGFAGVPSATVENHGFAFARSALPSMIRPEAIERIHWHKNRGDTVAVVSGSLDVYLRPWCRQYDIGLLCSSLEQRDGKLTGCYHGPQCVREEKVRRIRDAFDPPWTTASTPTATHGMTCLFSPLHTSAMTDGDRCLSIIDNRVMSDAPSPVREYLQTAFRWQVGRQRSGYDKMLLLHGMWPLPIRSLHASFPRRLRGGAAHGPGVARTALPAQYRLLACRSG